MLLKPLPDCFGSSRAGVVPAFLPLVVVGNLFDRQSGHLPLVKAILKPTHPVVALAQRQFFGVELGDKQDGLGYINDLRVANELFKIPNAAIARAAGIVLGRHDRGLPTPIASCVSLCAGSARRRRFDDQSMQSGLGVKNGSIAATTKDPDYPFRAIAEVF